MYTYCTLKTDHKRTKKDSSFPAHTNTRLGGKRSRCSDGNVYPPVFIHSAFQWKESVAVLRNPSVRITELIQRAQRNFVAISETWHLYPPVVSFEVGRWRVLLNIAHLCTKSLSSPLQTCLKCAMVLPNRPKFFGQNHPGVCVCVCVPASLRTLKRPRQAQNEGTVVSNDFLMVQDSQQHGLLTCFQTLLCQNRVCQFAGSSHHFMLAATKTLSTKARPRLVLLNRISNIVWQDMHHLEGHWCALIQPVVF